MGDDFGLMLKPTVGDRMQSEVSRQVSEGAELPIQLIQACIVTSQDAIPGLQHPPPPLRTLIIRRGQYQISHDPRSTSHGRLASPARPSARRDLH